MDAEEEMSRFFISAHTPNADEPRSVPRATGFSPHRTLVPHGEQTEFFPSSLNKERRGPRVYGSNGASVSHRRAIAATGQLPNRSGSRSQGTTYFTWSDSDPVSRDQCVRHRVSNPLTGEIPTAAIDRNEVRVLQSLPPNAMQGVSRRNEIGSAGCGLKSPYLATNARRIESKHDREPELSKRICVESCSAIKELDRHVHCNQQGLEDQGRQSNLDQHQDNPQPRPNSKTMPNFRDGGSTAGIGPEAFDQAFTRLWGNCKLTADKVGREACHGLPGRRNLEHGGVQIDGSACRVSPGWSQNARIQVPRNEPRNPSRTLHIPGHIYPQPQPSGRAENPESTIDGCPLPSARSKDQTTVGNIAWQYPPSIYERQISSGPLLAKGVNASTSFDPEHPNQNAEYLPLQEEKEYAKGNLNHGLNHFDFGGSPESMNWHISASETIGQSSYPQDLTHIAGEDRHITSEGHAEGTMMKHPSGFWRPQHLY